METLHTPVMPSLTMDRLKKSKSHLKWVSWAMIAVGVLAILFPVFSTFTLSIMVGSLMMVGGAIAFVASFSMTGTGPFFGSLLFSLLQLASGFIIFTRPGIGALVLTFIIGFIFMLEGAFYITSAFEIRPMKGWGWMAFSGAVSILAGLVLISALPTAALWVVGLLFGLNFLSSGISGLMVARSIASH